MKKIWITRPKDDAQRFCQALEDAGLTGVYEPVIQSLLDVEYINVDLDDLSLQSPIEGLIATSRNGVRALAQNNKIEIYFHLPFFAVGQSTGELAKSLGFRDVRVGGGRGADLLPLIREFALQANKTEPFTFLLLRGDVQAFDLKAALEQGEPPLNYEIENLICYRMREADHLPQELCDQLRTGEIGAVVLLSPRTAQVYKRLVIQHQLGSEASNLQHFCLSDAVADVLILGPENELYGFNPVDLKIADFPSQAHMIDSISLHRES